MAEAGGYSRTPIGSAIAIGAVHARDRPLQRPDRTADAVRRTAQWSCLDAILWVRALVLAAAPEGLSYVHRFWCKYEVWLIINAMHPFSSSLFHGRHFDCAIIILYVRWYITYKLSYRDLVEMMAERGVDVSQTTILRWVQCHVPEFERRWNCYAPPVGTSWRVDETYIRVRGRWAYLYRAVDKQGRIVDFLLSEHRNIAARQSFTQAIKQQSSPKSITLDGYTATHPAISELKTEEVLPQSTKVRTSKYRNNLIEQYHRSIKQRIYGIELAERIRKGQFDTSQTTRGGVRVPQVREVLLAA